MGGTKLNGLVVALNAPFLRVPHDGVPLGFGDWIGNEYGFGVLGDI